MNTTPYNGGIVAYSFILSLSLIGDLLFLDAKTSITKLRSPYCISNKHSKEWRLILKMNLSYGSIFLKIH